MIVLVLLFILLVLVVVHELGHFLMARAFGVRVDEFGVGYPPRAKKLFVWKETLFTLNWLPFGGFVKIFGEETTEVADPKTFAYQALWKRLLILVAGVFANLLLAVLLYTFAFSTSFLGSTKDFPSARIITPERVIVTDVLPHGLAELHGIKNGDVIVDLSLGREKVANLSAKGITAFIGVHGHDTITLTTSRKGQTQTLELPLNATGDTPALGVALVDAATLRLPVLTAFWEGVKTTTAYFILIAKAIVHIVISFVGGTTTMEGSVSGPVGIARIAFGAYTLGLGSFLMFMAIISINLAVINLVPFPALDGGRAVLELFSKKGKSRISKRVISLVNQFGFLALVVLMVYITYKDIVGLN